MQFIQSVSNHILHPQINFLLTPKKINSIAGGLDLISKYLVDKFSSLFISAGWFWKFSWSIWIYRLFLNCNNKEAGTGFLFVVLQTSHYHCSMMEKALGQFAMQSIFLHFFQSNRLVTQSEVKHSQPNKTAKNKEFIRWVSIMCGIF